MSPILVLLGLIYTIVSACSLALAIWRFCANFLYAGGEAPTLGLITGWSVQGIGLVVFLFLVLPHVKDALKWLWQAICLGLGWSGPGIVGHVLDGAAAAAQAATGVASTVAKTAVKTVGDVAGKIAPEATAKVEAVIQQGETLVRKVSDLSRPAVFELIAKSFSDPNDGETIHLDVTTTHRNGNTHIFHYGEDISHSAKPAAAASAAKQPESLPNPPATLAPAAAPPAAPATAPAQPAAPAA